MQRGEAAFVALPELGARDAVEALRALADAAARAIPGASAEELARCLADREILGSTAIGDGVALPHCRAHAAVRPLVLLGRSTDGVAFGAADGRPVRLFVATVTPAGSPAVHLRVLAELSRRLRDRAVVSSLLAAADAPEMLRAWEPKEGEAA